MIQCNPIITQPVVFDLRMNKHLSKKLKHSELGRHHAHYDATAISPIFTTDTSRFANQGEVYSIYSEYQARFVWHQPGWEMQMYVYWLVACLLQAISWTNDGFFVNFTLEKKFQWNSDQNTIHFIWKNDFEKCFWKQVTILCLSQYVNILY